MINITAPINSLGYGIASYNIIKHLVNSGQKIQFFPIGQPEAIEGSEFLNSIIHKEVSIDSPSVKIWHQHDIHHHVGKGMHVGFPIFELNKFTSEEKWSINHNDRIFACSEWAKQIIEDSTKIETKVVPLGVDTEIFVPSESSRPQTIFFNCGKWEIRKGHDILVDCFNSTFDLHDNVELWMMCDNPFYPEEQQQEWISLYKNSKLGDKIRVIPRQKNHKDVYDIMKQTDCGVFPSRAEGWNLELLEMMACGKTVIATDYSAHTEFCDKLNCRLIEIDSLELANDGVWFHGQGMWASIKDAQMEDIKNHMRDIHSNKQRGELAQNVDGIHTAQLLSWENSAKKFSEGLN